MVNSSAAAPEPVPPAPLQETMARATALLTGAWGGAVRLALTQPLRPAEARTAVLRCRVEAAPEGARAPASVVVKHYRGAPERPFDPADTTPFGPAGRFANEWCGLVMLHETAGAAPFAPAPYAAELEVGLLVMEDLGDDPSLAQVLQGQDPRAAEAALVAFAEGLGRVHGATVGRRASYQALRREAAPRGQQADERVARVARELEEQLTRFRQACDAAGVPLPAAAEAELGQVAREVAEPGPFDALVVSDTCPDNNRWRPAAGVRFFDLEAAGFDNAMMEAAYFWLPFPTCWCVNRLPEALPPRLEGVYREALAASCPAAGDEATFARALVAACLAWQVRTVGGDLVRTLEKDSQWGIATMRQRLPLRAANIARVTERHGQFPALGAHAAALAERLRSRWGEAAEMPLYPAFAG
jgi:hypothetical protein